MHLISLLPLLPDSLPTSGLLEGTLHDLLDELNLSVISTRQELSKGGAEPRGGGKK